MNTSTYFKRDSLVLLMVAGILFVFSLFLFYAFTYWGIPSDIKGHTKTMINLMSLGSFPTPPLYYLSVYLTATIFSLQFYNAAIIILATLIVLKFWITRHLITLNLPDIHINHPKITILSVMLLLVMPIHLQLFTEIGNGLNQALSSNMYLGKLAPNVWHNSTTIASMPFIILLMIQTFNYFKRDSIELRNIIFMAITGVIILLIKPSFLFAFIPALPLYLLIRHQFAKKTYVAIALSAFFFLFIIVEYYFVYIVDVYHLAGYDKTTLGIDLFSFWNFFSENIPLDALLSLVFPVSVLIAYKEQLKNDEILKFTWILLGFAYLVSILFTEIERPAFGNFSWQVIMVQYLLYAVSLRLYLSNTLTQNPQLLKNRIVLGVFSLHFITGLFYIYKLFALKSYM